MIELDRGGVAHIAATTEGDRAVFQRMGDSYNLDPRGADSLFAEALRSGQQIVANDMANEARVKNREALTRDGNYALALLPLQVAVRVAGLVRLRAAEAGCCDHGG